jgi:RNA polymerase sigma-70 factor (ECF subfamily)
MSEESVSGNREGALVCRAAEGDQEAFSRLVSRYHRPVINFAFRYLGNREEAEDAAQDAFVRLYFSLPRLRDPAKLASYLFTTALNVCRKRRRRRPESVPAAGEVAESPEEQALRQAEHERVAQAIAALPEAYRVTVSLRVDEGLSFAEISEIVGASEGALRVRYHRAREMLRAALAGDVLPAEGVG